MTDKQKEGRVLTKKKEEWPMDKIFKIGILVLGTIFLIIYFHQSYFHVSNGGESEIAEILKNVTSPLQLFTLSILICGTIFAKIAIKNNMIDLVKECIHMYLAVIGAITMIALWSPQSFFEPRDLRQNSYDFYRFLHALVPTLFFAAIGITYIIYQYKVGKRKEGKK